MPARGVFRRCPRSSRPSARSPSARRSDPSSRIAIGADSTSHSVGPQRASGDPVTAHGIRFLSVFQSRNAVVSRSQTSGSSGWPGSSARRSTVARNWLTYSVQPAQPCRWSVTATCTAGSSAPSRWPVTSSTRSRDARGRTAIVYSPPARRSAVLGIGEVEAAAGVPPAALVAVGRDAAGVLEHAGQVQQVPGHERGVAVGKVVVRSTRAGVQIGRSGTGLADPAGVGLWRDGVSQMLQAVEDVHGAVLDAVFVAGDEAAADPAVVGVLSGVVEQVRVAVQPLDDHLGHRTVVPQPDRAGDDEDVGRQHLVAVDGRPVVALPAVFGHVGPDAGGDVVVDGAQDLDGDAVLFHDCAAEVGQPAGVAELRGTLERAVDEQRAQVVIAGGHCLGRPSGGVSVHSSSASCSTCRSAGPSAANSSVMAASRWSRRSTRIPVAPQSRAYCAQSGLTSEVCQTGKSSARCSLAILPRALLLSSTCLTAMPYFTAVVSSMAYWPKPPSPVTATTGRLPSTAAQAPSPAG